MFTEWKIFAQPGLWSNDKYICFPGSLVLISLCLLITFLNWVELPYENLH